MLLRFLTHHCRFFGAALYPRWRGLALIPPLVLAGVDLLLPSLVKATEGRSIELVLDASGSMNGRLADGTVKLSAAKKAVAQLVQALDPGVRLAYRAYGHQSPREAHDCKDVELLVGFGGLEDVRVEVLKHTSALCARGYTPITDAIGLAADDLKAEAAQEPVVVLVSDGKESCAGDPCAIAKKLKEANAKLVVHTIGFGVASGGVKMDQTGQFGNGGILRHELCL